MIKILLADDHRIIREGLHNKLETMAEFSVVGEAENGLKALRLAKKLAPDVVIMDISMPELNGIEAARQIKAEVPGVKIIALSMYADKRYVLGMLKAGVCGYLIKDCALKEVTEAITIVHRGETYLSPKIADTMRITLLTQLEESSVMPSSVLSDRERQILQLIAEGAKTRDIAESLHLSIKTVESHRGSIMQKLNLFSVAELTKYALREGLTSLER
ncbi:MAG: response regulator transcription factor [Desulfobacterales bacterium]|nr:response regulator transcription factor [Desulfobacterales bacterium]